MQNDLLTYYPPTLGRSPVLLNVPHSGRDYPSEFIIQSDLSLHNLRSSEDAYVDHLLDFAKKSDVSLLIAKIPRAFIDLNRAANELDPAIIEGLSHSMTLPRVSTGLGVIPRVVAKGKVIRKGKMSLDAAKGRIARYYWPYHHQLLQVLSDIRERNGHAILLDCHSMPEAAIAHANRNVDIILSNYFGSSSDKHIFNQLENSLKEEGFSVAKNEVFTGGFITRHYGQPTKGFHAIQIEINRGLYLNEETLEKTFGFNILKERLERSLSRFINHSAVIDEAAE